MAKLNPNDPFTDTGFDELFRGFFKAIRVENSGSRQGLAAVEIDVTEDDKSSIVPAEIPGVNKDEIQVTVEGNPVTLGAEGKREGR